MGMRRFRSLNPHDNATLGDVKITTEEEVRAKVAAARAAQPGWHALGISGRIAALKNFTRIFSQRADEFAALATKEMGMPIEASKADVGDAIRFFEWYLNNAEKYLSPEVTFENEKEIHTTFHEPHGVAGVIVPWNYPASNFVWGCGQNLIAGNTVVFKHSEEVPLCGKLIEELMIAAGIPDDVFSEIYGRGPVGSLLSRLDIDLICFTGSTDVGLSLYRTAAQHMKRIVMELGGSAPGIIFEDADLAEAVPHVFDARFSNAGQMCDALKRLLVHESVWDEVVERLTAKIGMIQIGNPLVAQNHMGPLAAKRQVDTIERQVTDAITKGAIVITGGKRPGLMGAYYEPTILSNVTRDMRVWQEETFGPVLPLMRFSTEEEAIMLANDTIYGLGAYIYTKDAARGDRVATAIKSGMVSVNGTSYVQPSNPFGGYKASGLGREHGRWGFQDVTQTKVVARKK